MKNTINLKLIHFLCCIKFGLLLAGCSSLNNAENIVLQTADEQSLAEQNLEAFYQMRPLQQSNLIKAGDSLSIEILNDQTLSSEYIVGSDGEIQMPFIGTVNAKGLRPIELQDRLTNLYNDGYFVSPNIVVNHDSTIEIGKIVVDGAVGKPGVFELSGNMKFTEAIAMAGGILDTAESEKIFVVRNVNGERIAFPFSFNDIHLARAEDPVMLAEDVVYVQNNEDEFEAEDLLKWLPLVNTAMLAAIRF